MVALSEGHVEIFKLLLDKGAEVNLQNEVSSKYFACMYPMACDLCTGCWHWDLFIYTVHIIILPN